MTLRARERNLPVTLLDDEDMQTGQEADEL